MKSDTGKEGIHVSGNGRRHGCRSTASDWRGANLRLGVSCFRVARGRAGRNCHTSSRRRFSSGMTEGARSERAFVSPVLTMAGQSVAPSLLCMFSFTAVKYRAQSGISQLAGARGYIDRHCHREQVHIEPEPEPDIWPLEPSMPPFLLHEPIAAP